MRKELFIGCVDARHRLGAYGLSVKDMFVLRDFAAHKSPGDNDLEVALEYAIKSGVTVITDAGHSDCGAVCACVDGAAKLPAVMHHLSPLASLATEGDATARKRRLECAAVHTSIKNLRSYDCLREAEAKGELTFRRCLIDIKTKQLHELSEDGTVPAVDPDFPPHNPAMLLFGGMDPCASVSALGIEPGQSLIVRNFGAFVKAEDKGTAAALEFAIKAKHVQKIAIALDTDCALVRACMESEPRSPAMEKYLEPLAKDLDAIYRKYPSDEAAQMEAIQKLLLRRSLENLQNYPSVHNAKNLTLEAWLVDVHSDNKEKLVVQSVDIGAVPQFREAGERYERR